MAIDEFNQGQVVLVRATLTDPANDDALTDDPALTLVAYRADGTQFAMSVTSHVSLGVYTAQFVADTPGYVEVNDNQGGLYHCYVRPVMS